MSYEVIARKWRPQSFGELVGQPHVSQTLSNALSSGRIHHAILLTGPRGTGKTSTARILAKSLRCENAVNFVPCHKCSSCLDISAGRSLDVLEIDGASNNGVDAIRDLREGVAFMPSSGKFKVYIIDEVHMLSGSAFNALLKTLEEPPAHVIFILATTEVQKIPITILSRCQRFDFRTIPVRQITDHLKKICSSEGFAFEEDGLWIIARQGAGSMRDSLSLLDQVITFSNGQLTRKNVVEILGLSDQALVLEVLTQLVQRDPKSLVASLGHLQASGHDPAIFAKDLLQSVRNLLFVKIVDAGQGQSLIELPDSEIRFMQDLGANTSSEDLHLIFDMLTKAAQDVVRSSQPEIALEMGLMRIAIAPQVRSLQQLIAGTVQTNPGTPSTHSSPLVATPKEVSPSPAQTKKPIDSLGLSPQEKWFQFVNRVKSIDALLAAKLEPLVFISENDNKLEVGVPAKLAFLAEQLRDKEVQAKLQNLLQTHLGPKYQLSWKTVRDVDAGTSAQSMAKQIEKNNEQDMAKKVAEHPKVVNVQEMLKAQIKSIKATRAEKPQ